MLVYPTKRRAAVLQKVTRFVQINSTLFRFGLLSLSVFFLLFFALHNLDPATYGTDDVPLTNRMSIGIAGALQAVVALHRYTHIVWTKQSINTLTKKTSNHNKSTAGGAMAYFVFSIVSTSSQISLCLFKTPTFTNPAGETYILGKFLHHVALLGMLVYFSEVLSSDNEEDDKFALHAGAFASMLFTLLHSINTQIQLFPLINLQICGLVCGVVLVARKMHVLYHVKEKIEVSWDYIRDSVFFCIAVVAASSQMTALSSQYHSTGIPAEAADAASCSVYNMTMKAEAARFQLTALFPDHGAVLRFLGGALFSGTIAFYFRNFIQFTNSTQHALQVKVIGLQCVVIVFVLGLTLHPYSNNEAIPSFVNRSASKGCVGMQCDREFALPHVVHVLLDLLVTVFVPSKLIDLHEIHYHFSNLLNTELQEQENEFAGICKMNEHRKLAEQMLTQQVCRRDSNTNQVLAYNPVEQWYVHTNVNVVLRIICNEHAQSFVPLHESLLAFHLCRLSTVHAAQRAQWRAEPVSALQRFNTTWPPIVNDLIQTFLFPRMVKRKILNDIRVHWAKNLNKEGFMRQTQLYAAVEDLDEGATLYCLMQDGIEVNKGGVPRKAETQSGVNHYETSLDFLEEVLRKGRCYEAWEKDTTRPKLDPAHDDDNDILNIKWELPTLKLKKCLKIRKLLLQHGAKRTDYQTMTHLPGDLLGYGQK